MQSNGQFNVGFVIVLTALLFVFTTVSFAQPNNCVNNLASDFGGKQKRFIQKFDQNDDGKVSKEEFPGTEEFFTKHDRNQDGYIDATEIPKGPPKHRRRCGDFIQIFDQDKDGKVSKEELPGTEEFFTKHDLNQDGYIDNTEKPEKPPCHGQRWGNFIQNFDKDEDGKVSKEEFPGPKAFFDKHDLNQDGFIDDTEIPKNPPKRRHRMGKDRI